MSVPDATMGARGNWLDEAANVCHWRDLPDLYSHYGSRGIPIMSVFQSWSQGIGVFGKEGMLKLWSAANVKLYAGGSPSRSFWAWCPI